MRCAVDLSSSGNALLCLLVIDRQGIIRSAEFLSEECGAWPGWPTDSLVGRDFMSVHEGQNIPKHDISEGVVGVCEGKASHFNYQFELVREHTGARVELSVTPLKEGDAIELSYQQLGPACESYGHDSSYEDRLVNDTNIHEALFHHVPVGILYHDSKGMITLANPESQRILGQDEEALKKLTAATIPWQVFDKNEQPLNHEDFPAMRSLRTGEPVRDVTIGLQYGEGPLWWVKVNTEIIHDKHSSDLKGVLSSFIDITEERLAQMALEAQTERTQIAVESAEMGVWDWIPEGKKMLWDKKLFQIYGYPDDTTISADEAWKTAVHPDDVERVNRESMDMVENSRHKKIDFRTILPNGSIRHVRTQARVMKDAKGSIKRVIGVTHDITNAVMSERKLWELAYTDPLTGIRSRAGLNVELSNCIAEAIQQDEKFAVLMMGINRFKEINDNYGLSLGDKVLVEVSRRAVDFVTGKDTVARIAGDEFACILRGIDPEKSLEDYIAAFREKVLGPMPLNEGVVVNLDASIGVSVFPDDGYDATTLQSNAGLAMHNCRAKDECQYMCYDASMSEEVSRRFNLKYQLYAAVKDEEFQLFYQPIIDLQSGDVIGCEALIRWKDSLGRFVSPMEFIPMVEESGLIYELGKWINLTAVKQWKLWQQLVADLKYISVNVSPRQLEQAEFYDDLTSMVAEHEINPENLQLEITEGTFLKESLNADGVLRKLARKGFRLAIDDFGTGYSSLAYLKRFNVDVIKIDRSFIRDIETDQSDRDIVSAILAMNKKLGFKTLVEGVETDEQNKIVQKLGCDSAQGYLYGKPTFADEFAEIYIQPPCE